MIVNEVEGNLVSMFLEQELNMVHGCNCFCRMGRGIALEVKNRVPRMWKEDQTTQVGSYHKLGHCTWIVQNDMVGVNAYTQYHWARPVEGTNRMVCYDAVRQVFKRINKAFGNKKFNTKPFGIPLIGAGLAKGDWEVIKRIINEETPDLDIVVVHYKA